MSVAGKIALITGGTRGIGLAIVHRLRMQGAKVAVIGRSEKRPECDLYLKYDLISRHCDVISTIINVFGSLDILINNAGAHNLIFEKSLYLMLISPYELSRQAIEVMPRGGHIVNILSVAAFQAARNIDGYIAAKHGLLGLTRAMAIKYAPDIHINAVAPGHIETDMLNEYSEERKEFLKSITPAKRFGKPEEIADAVMFLLNSGYIYGQTIVVDGGWLVKNG